MSIMTLRTCREHSRAVLPEAGTTRRRSVDRASVSGHLCDGSGNGVRKSIRTRIGHAGGGRAQSQGRAYEIGNAGATRVRRLAGDESRRAMIMSTGPDDRLNVYALLVAITST